MHGMSCSSCVGNITNTVEQLGFVERVDVNLVAHSCTILFHGRDNEGLIPPAIEELGYTATKVQMSSLGKEERKIYGSSPCRSVVCTVLTAPIALLQLCKHLTLRSKGGPTLTNRSLPYHTSPAPRVDNLNNHWCHQRDRQVVHCLGLSPTIH